MSQQQVPQQEEVVQEEPISYEEEQRIDEPMEVDADGKFMLCDEDVEFVRGFRVEAEDEDSAKRLMVEMFELHLDMIELKRG